MAEKEEEKNREKKRIEKRAPNAKAGKKSRKAKKQAHLEEAKEKKHSGKKKGKNAFIGFVEEKPMVVAGIASIAIIAMALFIAFSPKSLSLEDFLAQQNGNGQETGAVKMIVLTSNRCPDCENFSTLEAMFIVNGVKYEIQEIKESTEDGQALIQATGAKSLPFYLIDEKTISGNAVVKTASGFQPLKNVLQYYVGLGKGTYNEGIFAFPEMNLDNGPVKPVLLLGEPCGSKKSFDIQMFLDPYDPNTIGRSQDYENLRGVLSLDTDINVAFHYNYLPTYSAKMVYDYIQLYGGSQETVVDNVERAADYLICANDMGNEAFINMERSFYASYCDANWSVANSGDTRYLWNCSDSNHFGVWINAEELVLAERRADLEGDLDFYNCLYNVDEKKQIMQLIADTAGINRTPSAIVNCQYVVPADEKITQTICMINPEIRFCG